jgi:hypothetical protein
MPDKVEKTRLKGRPSKPKQTKIEKDCLEHYENYESAGYAAQLLGLNRHTVEKYFQNFAAKEIEITNEMFIQRQRATKARVLIKLDGLIAKLKAQIDRVELSDTDYSTEGVNQERLLQKSITDMNQLIQDKAAIEMTPTLDIHIEAELDKKYGQPSESNPIRK